MKNYDSYPLPPANTHPRVFMLEKDYDELRKKAETPALKSVYHKLKGLQYLTNSGKFTRLMSKDLGYYGNDLFECIKINAYFRLLENDDNAGRVAIDKLFNIMDTLDFEVSILVKEVYTRGGGELLTTLAVVYDWCFDLLSQEEKDRIWEYGKFIMSNMEIGYPPSTEHGGCVTSHTGEAQLMRDTLSFAIAFFDEHPELYHNIAKNLFENFIPVRDFVYKSHTYHQGHFYGTFRFQWEIYLAWIYRKMGYDNIFSEEQQYVPYSWLYSRLPDGQLIKDGDCVAATLPDIPYWDRAYGRTYLLTASYYGDPYLLHEYERCDLYGKYEPIDGANHLLEKMLFADPYLESKSLDDLPLTKLCPEPYGLMLMRTSFDLDDQETVVASFKIGNYMFKNHQHRDNGNFQIFYKDILTLNSGLYYSAIQKIAYRSPHRMEYVRHTISHNCMLFCDTTIKGDNGGQKCEPGAQDPHYRTLDEMLSDDCIFAKTIQQHNCDDYSYVSADLTNSYEKTRITDYKRSFVFINTKETAIPAIIVVYDYAIPASENIKPYWVVHSMNKPEIQNDTLVIKNKGKLTNKIYLPEKPEIDLVGGEGHEFDTFGKNYEAVEVVGAITQEGKWRAQVSDSTKGVYEYLNVMAVSDDGVPVPADLSQFEKLENGCKVTVSGYQITFTNDGKIDMKKL